MAAEQTVEQEYAAARPKSQALHERAVDEHAERRRPRRPRHLARSRSTSSAPDGRAQVGRRRPPLSRLLERPRRPHARPQPSRHRGGHHRAGEEGPALQRVLRARGALGRAHPRCVPGAERVRFTMTGTETTALAIRIARAATGRPRSQVPGSLPRRARLRGGRGEGSVRDPHVGRRAGRRRSRPRCVARCNDLAQVRELLDEHEVAAVILEPAARALDGGAHQSRVPARRCAS